MIVGVDQLSPTDGMLADLTVEAMLDPRMEVLQAGEATFDEKQMAMSAIVEEFYPGVRHLAQKSLMKLPGMLLQKFGSKQKLTNPDPALP